jgi:hypothetical protein
MAATSPAKTTPNKSDFIRNQPLDMSVATVVAIAKSQGLTVSDSLVRKVRGAGEPKANAPKKTLTVAAVPKAETPKKTAKKIAAKLGAVETKLVPGTSKTDFIRAQPASLSAADVIAKGKTEGIKFTPQLVYRVRGSAKAKSSKAASGTKPAAATTSTPNPPSKRAFIRAIPFSVSAKDVVAQGKAAGLKFNTDYVQRARKTANDVATKPTSPVPTSATPKAPAKLLKSKADFVRAYSSLSPKEIVEKGKAEGVKFDARYVYRVRAMDKAARKRKRAAAKTLTSTPKDVNGTGASVMSAAPSSSAEDLLRAVAAELGLGKAVEILAGERARVQSILKG